MTPLSNCAQAIAEVRERYVLVMRHSGECYVCEKQPFHDSMKTRVGAVEAYVLAGTRAECQLWIDCEAARACLLALLPVSDALVREAAFGFSSMNPVLFPRLKEALTAAIQSITRED